MSKHKGNKVEELVSELAEESLEAQETTLEEELLTLRSEVEALNAKIQAMTETVETADDKVLRAHAEMENIRRRAQKDIENARKYALEKFAEGLLPILDSLEKAIEAASQSQDAVAIAEGVELTQKMFIDTLAKFGVTQIAPLGEPFDPNKHEAMAMQPSPEMDDNQVMSVFQNGYELNGRVIRSARVLVVKN